MSPYRLPMVISAALPIPPTDTDNIIRTVRHGLADVLEWLGEEVGPASVATLRMPSARFSYPKRCTTSSSPH